MSFISNLNLKVLSAYFAESVVSVAGSTPVTVKVKVCDFVLFFLSFAVAVIVYVPSFTLLSTVTVNSYFVRLKALAETKLEEEPNSTVKSTISPSSSVASRVKVTVVAIWLSKV